MFPLNPFHQNPAPWGSLELKADKDAIVVLGDGVQARLKDLSSPVLVDVAYILGVSERSFGRLCGLVHADRMEFYEMRVADLAPLAQIPNLRHLAIRWNTKATSAAPLARLNLVGLILDKTPKITDLNPIGDLHDLEYFAFTGGMHTKNTARSLAPLANVPKLKELRLLNVKVEAAGLTPLAGCPALKKLEISNHFPTEEYAFLSVHLPNTACSLFSPWVKHGGSDKDVMIVGSRKPFLNSSNDRARIEGYEHSFAELKKQFALDKTLRPDGTRVARSGAG